MKPDRPAVEIVNARGRSPIVLLCEHASAFIPPSYDRLGLTADQALSHIAWDIGAEAVARDLAQRLDAPLFVATHSRLLIDLNRPPDVASAIPLRSEDIDVPGNVAITAQERTMRIAQWFDPYHAAVSALLDDRAARGVATRLLSLHSFTRTYLGERRDCDIGVLFDRAQSWAGHLLAALAKDERLRVAANEPYAIGPEWDYAVPVHGDARGLDAILLELCNDLIADAAGQRDLAQRVAQALSEI